MILKENGNIDIIELFKKLRWYSNVGEIGTEFYLPNMGEKVVEKDVCLGAQILMKTYQGYNFFGTMKDLMRPEPSYLAKGFSDEEEARNYYENAIDYDKENYFIEYGYKLVKSEKLTLANSGKLFKGHIETLPEDKEENRPYEKDIRRMRELRDLMFDNATNWRWLTFKIDPGEFPMPEDSPKTPDEIEVLVGRLVKLENSSIVKTPNWIGFRKYWSSLDI